jgi:hypothetical protein
VRLRVLPRLTLLVATIMVGVSAETALAHPLHTSLAELAYDPATKEIRISVRVFVDDLTKASEAYARSRTRTTAIQTSVRSADSPIVAYARASFVVADRTGRVLLLASCGEKQVGDLLWICFRAPAPAGLSGFRVAHRMLFDLYSDQVNIVQASYNGNKVSLLFTRGDGFKRLE